MAGMFNDLGKAVGPDMPNQKEDVKLVQKWLSRWSRNPWISQLGENAFDAQTRSALENFQRRVMRQTMPSGVVRPRDATAKRLSNPPGTCPGNRKLSLPPRTDFAPLAEEDYQEAAEELECEVRAIKAVANVESYGSGFDYRQRPRILFEQHLFNKYTNRQYSKSHPDLTHEKPKGKGSNSDQWKRLKAAYALNASAALQATSWGKFQLLGRNFNDSGFPLIELFVAAMCASEKAQLEAFVTFIKADQARLEGLQKKNWPQFARYYNGSDYRKWNYDVNIKAAYDKLGK